VSLPALRAVPDVQADWEPLEEAAAALDAEARRAEETLRAATVSWSGLQEGYRHDETSDRVWAGLAPLTGPAEEWAAALGAARAALEDFTHAGRSAQHRRESLQEQRAGLLEDRSGVLAAGDGAQLERVRERILEFNDAAADLDRSWAAAQETFASALGAVRGGTTEGLAAVGTPRLDTGVLDWAAMTGELDGRFGRLDPGALWRDLRGLSDENLRHWLEANPEAAQALAEHRLPEHPAPGSAEETMTRARDRGDAAHVREAWLGLAEHERERLALLYPAVIGNLDGVPLATRGHTHRITVAGLREKTATSLRDHLDRRPLQAPGNADQRSEWEDERERLETVLSGLEQAWDASGRPQYPEDRQAAPGYATVFVSAEGHGQIVTMRGEPSGATERAVTFVPGTHSTIASVDRYNDALNALDGHDPEGTVSIYWQGTDLPQELVRDNITPRLNEAGAPRLAAFDAAADLEMSTTRTRHVTTTYVGHSAGGSLLGTAERLDLGLNATNIVYVAPAGTGHEVSSPEDTANEFAHRFLIQTNDDPIEVAQLVGGGAHGGSFLEGSDPVRQMGAVRLESGLLADGSIMTGHSDYFEHGSTSARNIQGVVYGEDVHPYLRPEVTVYPGSSYPVICYPLEQDLDRYREQGIPRVPVHSLTD